MVPEAVAGLVAGGYAGANVTIPHKVAVIQHLDGLGLGDADRGANGSGALPREKARRSGARLDATLAQGGGALN